VETTIQADKETKRTGTIIQVEMGINKMVITVKTVKEIIISLKAIQLAINKLILMMPTLHWCGFLLLLDLLPVTSLPFTIAFSIPIKKHLLWKI